MQGPRKRGRALSLKHRLLEQSQIFSAFGRIFEASIDQDKIKAEKARAEVEKDIVLAKVCTGLSEVCKMLAEHAKEESNSAGKA